MTKFILRVDDVGWLPPEKTKDNELRYFALWREYFGSAGLPAYYGVIPTQVGVKELAYLKRTIRGGEELAVHGYTHAQGEIVTQDAMYREAIRFREAAPCTSYIPPFNAYCSSTISDWSLANNSAPCYFFGGFNGEHHTYGNLPKEVFSNCWHLPATRACYDHLEPLVKQLPAWLDLNIPIVVTLHATWDHTMLSRLPEVMDLIKERLVSADYIHGWARRAELNLNSLTAAHYFAYKIVCDKLGTMPLGRNVLDFGSRYSVLPSKISLRGHRVTAYDRALSFETDQNQAASNLGATVKTTRELSGSYDVITAVWAIQHNEREAMPVILRKLGSMLLDGGRIIIVSSLSTRETFYQGLDVRADPQWVLNWDDHLITFGETDLYLLGQPIFFNYEHGTNRGKILTRFGMEVPEGANAVCYELAHRKLQ